jgi:aryl-alcohol dehydrogenase-like predicted oxidoreductase
MRQRRFGRLGWQVGEVGYGMWGMAGWSGSDDDESRASLRLAAEMGVTFFDTAWAYGDGRSERLLGELVRVEPERRLYTATKLPPKDRHWPPLPDAPIEEAYPPAYIREYAEKSLANLGLSSMDLLQFHVWSDAWADDDGWQRAMDDLKREGLIGAVGVSVNRWEPWNVLRTLRTGMIDAVQVIYNVFEQAPEDDLFPLCRELDVAVIARVPLEEGALTGTLTLDATWPDGDWRATYFVPENLKATVARVEALRPLVPAGMTMPEMAIRYVLSNPDVATVIPGMRAARHVRANVAAGEAGPLPADLRESLRAHRWDRKPTRWSQ